MSCFWSTRVRRAFMPFDTNTFSRAVDRQVWTTMPSPGGLVPVIEEVGPDVVNMSSWNGEGCRAVMKAMKGRALRVVFTSHAWHGGAKQCAGWQPEDLSDLMHESSCLILPSHLEL